MNDIEVEILAAIHTDPLASQQELATKLGMSRESIAGYIMRLTRKGAILGKGYILPKENNIVVIGGANVDISGTADGAYRDGDSNPGLVSQSAGGVGRNIAENLARLGNDVSMITLVGKDSRGRFLVDHATEIGMNVQGFVQHPELATSTYLALHNKQGELVGSIADMAIIDHLSPELLSEKMSRLQAASTLVVDANLPTETLAWLADQNLTPLIVADAVSATKAVRLRPLLHKIDLLKVNRFEALAILGKDENETISGTAIIAALLSKGVRAVLLSLAEQGVLFESSDDAVQQTVPECEMVSDTGAGDALLAGYVHAAQLYETVAERVDFSLACAATTLEAKTAVNTQLTENFVIKRFNKFLRKTNKDIKTTELENQKK